MNTLLPDPLHPAVVHLPIAFAMLAPLAALVALWFTRRTASHRGPWGVPIALLLLLAVSSWVATETGEDQEDRVEAVVPELALETHEERADTFLTVVLVVLGVSLVGAAPGAVGLAARALTTAATAVILVAGYQVGHSGGELVYTHGAAAAYVGDAAGVAPRER
jgi:uncharacterized membrane protein